MTSVSRTDETMTSYLWPPSPSNSVETAIAKFWRGIEEKNGRKMQHADRVRLIAHTTESLLLKRFEFTTRERTALAQFAHDFSLGEISPIWVESAPSRPINEILPRENLIAFSISIIIANLSPNQTIVILHSFEQNATNSSKMAGSFFGTIPTNVFFQTASEALLKPFDFIINFIGGYLLYSDGANIEQAAAISGSGIITVHKTQRYYSNQPESQFCRAMASGDVMYWLAYIRYNHHKPMFRENGTLLMAFACGKFPFPTTHPRLVTTLLMQYAPIGAINRILGNLCQAMKDELNDYDQKVVDPYRKDVMSNLPRFFEVLDKRCGLDSNGIRLNLFACNDGLNVNCVDAYCESIRYRCHTFQQGQRELLLKNCPLIQPIVLIVFSYLDYKISPTPIIPVIMDTN